jgi:hypothetical protein
MFEQGLYDTGFSSRMGCLFAWSASQQKKPGEFAGLQCENFLSRHQQALAIY